MWKRAWNFLRSLAKIARGLATIALVALGWTILVDIDPYGLFRGTDKARDILAKSPQAQGTDIEQKWAIEFLYENEKMPERVNLAYVPLRNLDLRPREAIALEGANLQMAIMPGAILEHAHLECANLWRADLTGAFLTDAKLQYSRLFGAFLQGADLSGADLTGADLTQADISGADFRGATVTAKQLDKACSRDQDKEPLVDEDVRPAKLWPLDCGSWTKESIQSAPPPKCLIE